MLGWELFLARAGAGWLETSTAPLLMLHEWQGFSGSAGCQNATVNATPSQGGAERKQAKSMLRCRRALLKTGRAAVLWLRKQACVRGKRLNLLPVHVAHDPCRAARAGGAAARRGAARHAFYAAARRGAGLPPVRQRIVQVGRYAHDGHAGMKCELPLAHSPLGGEGHLLAVAAEPGRRAPHSSASQKRGMGQGT
jgi:hypothetical protein